jgi:DNA-directed RNA polymerase specialized sigma24 family protein
MMSLTPLQRVALHLHYSQGMTHDAIAARQKVSRQAVTAALQRGKAKLRELLK